MNRDEWSEAFLDQARADFETFCQLAASASLAKGWHAPACHRLHFLQMACEKLCKAHLLRAGARPDDVRRSHAHIAGQLPTIFNQYYAEAIVSRSKIPSHVMQSVRKLAREIELLAPAVDDGGGRPDNCEYPWLNSSGHVTTPRTYAFPCQDLLQQNVGTTLLKVLRSALK